MVKAFISYAHRDEVMKHELLKHLAPMIRSGQLEIWHDRMLFGGDVFSDEIRDRIDGADLFLALVSAHFLASDYCVEKEFQHALEQTSSGALIILPVILRPCHWTAVEGLAQFNAAPTGGKPIADFPNQDTGFMEVVASISAVIDRPKQMKAVAATDAPALGQNRPAVVRPIPIKRPDRITDHDRDAYRIDAFKRICATLEATAKALDGDLQFQARFRQIDANRASLVVYMNGAKASALTVFTGGHSFGADGIGWNDHEDGDTNSMSGKLTVAASDGTLGLVDDGFGGLGMMGRASGGAMLDPDEAAAVIWNQVFERAQWKLR